MITYVSKITDNLLWKPLTYVHEIVASNIPGSAILLLKIQKIWLKGHNNNIYYFHSYMFIFNIVPKILTSFVFFFDIVLLGSFKYFLYTLPLLLIPILFNIFLKTFESLAFRNIPVLQEYFSKIKFIGNKYDKEGNLIISNLAEYEFHVKPEYSNMEEELREIIPVLYQLNTIIDFVAFIRERLQYITPYVTLTTSSIYFIGGLYRLIYFLN